VLVINWACWPSGWPCRSIGGYNLSLYPLYSQLVLGLCPNMSWDVSTCECLYWSTHCSILRLDLSSCPYWKQMSQIHRSLHLTLPKSRTVKAIVSDSFAVCRAIYNSLMHPKDWSSFRFGSFMLPVHSFTLSTLPNSRKTVDFLTSIWQQLDTFLTVAIEVFE